MSRTSFEMKNIVVRAGAGAGKTTDLTQRVLSLAEDYYSKEGKWPKFVVTTFTRKATQELRERLAVLAMSRDQQNPAGPRLLSFVKSSSHLHISTIHGVLGLFLQKYGSRMGLSPHMKITSESQELNQLKKLIRNLCVQNDEFGQLFQELLEDFSYQSLLEMLHESSKWWIQHQKLHAVTKDQLLTEIRSEIESWCLSAQDLSMEISKTVENEKWRDWAQVLNGVSRELASFVGQVEEIKTRLALLPKVVKSKTIPEDVADKKSDLMDLAKDLVKPSRSLAFVQEHERLTTQFTQISRTVAAEMIEKKLEQSEMTMADMELLSLYLIRKDPEAAVLFGKMWNYWLIDEYQDTSPLQVQLLSELIQGTPHFVVGDPQQSIYLFRGARSEVFLEKEEWLSKQGGSPEPRMNNWRSFPETLEFSNELFTKLNPRQFQRMIPTEKDRGKKIEETAANIFVVPQDDDQQNEIRAQIFRAQELMKKGARPESICILARKNDDLDKISQMATRFKLPVQVHSSGQFFRRREVIDGLSLLKFLVNPHDNKNLLVLLRSPMLRISDQTLVEWVQQVTANRDRKGSYWSSFSQGEHSVIDILKRGLVRVQSVGVGAAWSELLVANNFFNFSFQLDRTGRREANLWKLVSMVRSQERRPGFQYLDFIHNRLWMDLSTESGGGEMDAVPVVEPQRIQLMTIHASKGLEFDHVIIGQCGQYRSTARSQVLSIDEKSGLWTMGIIDPEEGKMKSSLFGEKLTQINLQREIEEYDRQLYVAVTRAKQSVTMVWSENPKNGSWGARFPLSIVSDGVHRENTFSYEVRRGVFEPAMMEDEVSQTRDLKPPWSSLEKSASTTVSVTELLSKELQNRNTVLRVEGLEKALTGVRVHRLFENLKYHFMRDPSFSWESLLPALDKKTQKALRYLCESEQGRWLKLIFNGEVEYGFGVTHNEGLIQGQIDLWGRDANGEAWIVDYKTGSPEHKEKAFEQLRLYASALKQMKKIKEEEVVQLAVIYPFSEITFAMKI